MTQLNTLEAARQGDVNAIASLLNHFFQPKGITATAALKDDCLQVTLAAERVLNRDVSVKRIHRALLRLAAKPIKRVKVYGKKNGDEFPQWEAEFELAAEQPSGEPNAATESQDTSSQSETSSWFGSIFGAASNFATQAGGAATNAGELFGEATERAKGMADAIGTTAAKASEAAMGAMRVFGDAAGKVTEGTGYLLEVIQGNPALKQLNQGFKADWLVNLLDRVDVETAEGEVKRLQREYPHETPPEIAHRIMLQKAMLAGGSSLATNLLPSSATPLLAVDLASTTLLHAEMIYQIAGVYGVDLKNPERKAEVLAIFGLSLGGKQAIEAGLEVLFRNIPVAGAVIGAGSNAVMVYALGYGACRFYEAKLNSQLPLSAELEAIETESNQYFEDAIAQETIMDRILVHVILAGNPGKTRAEILPELQAANLSPASLETIAAHLESPPDLTALLEQVTPDFAVPLLAQADRIARLDGVITPEEAQVLETIATFCEQKQQSFDVGQYVREAARQLTRDATRSRQTNLLSIFKNIIFGKLVLDEDLDKSIERISAMKGEEFEEFLSLCFGKLGYSVQDTPKTNDFGADLILTKSGIKTIVQAKRYKSTVGSKAVQEVVSAVQYYGADGGIVVTNSTFTPSAYQLASRTKTELWDKEKLIDLITQAKNV
ncbi:MAG: restriction endonuclease [Cyanobacteriota bacterium]|nr:restriction endonuclease [Cyanobacteriota bacterium]